MSKILGIIFVAYMLHLFVAAGMGSFYDKVELQEILGGVSSINIYFISLAIVLVITLVLKKTQDYK